MAAAVGYIGGIPINTAFKSGVRIPTNKPYFSPKINPHKRTGICIGRNICPVMPPVI
jgi:hypothetical protein